MRLSREAHNEGAAESARERGRSRALPDKNKKGVKKMAEKKTVTSEDERILKRIEANEARMRERVSVRLYKDNYKCKDPVFVSVNGYSARIPRGVNVMIPRVAAEVIKESIEQDEHTAAMLEGLSEDYDRNVRRERL